MADESPKRPEQITKLAGIGLLLFIASRLVTSGLPVIYLFGLFGAALVGVCLWHSNWCQSWRKSFLQWQEEQAIHSAWFEKQHGAICRLEAKIERRIRRIWRYYLFELDGIGDRGDVTARLYFKKDADIEKAKSAGILVNVLNIIYEEIENAGRGTRESVAVDFQVDSIENVDKKHGGRATWPLR